MSRIETTIKNSIAEIARVVELIEELASLQQLPPSSIWPLNVALDEVLQRFHTWEVDWDNAVQARTSTVRGWERLPVFTS